MDETMGDKTEVVLEAIMQLLKKIASTQPKINKKPYISNLKPVKNPSKVNLNSLDGILNINGQYEMVNNLFLFY